MNERYEHGRNDPRRSRATRYALGSLFLAAMLVAALAATLAWTHVPFAAVLIGVAAIAVVVFAGALQMLLIARGR